MLRRRKLGLLHGAVPHYRCKVLAVLVSLMLGSPAAAGVLSLMVVTAGVLSPTAADVLSH